MSEQTTDPLASARARIRERLTDKVLHAIDETIDMTYTINTSEVAQIVVDAIAPLLAEVELEREDDFRAAEAHAERYEQAAADWHQNYDSANRARREAEARVEALQRERDEARELHRCGPLVCPFEARAEAEKQRADALAAELLEVKSTWQGWGNERSAFLADVAAKIETHKSNAKTWREAIEERLNLLIEKAAERDALAVELKDAMSSREGWKETAGKLAAELAALREDKDMTQARYDATVARIASDLIAAVVLREQADNQTFGFLPNPSDTDISRAVAVARAIVEETQRTELESNVRP